MRLKINLHKSRDLIDAGASPELMLEQAEAEDEVAKEENNGK